MLLLPGMKLKISAGRREAFMSFCAVGYRLAGGGDGRMSSFHCVREVAPPNQNETNTAVK